MLVVRSEAISSRLGDALRAVEQRQRPLDQLVVGAARLQLADRLSGDLRGLPQRPSHVRLGRLGKPRLVLAAAAQLGVHAEHDPPQSADVEGGDRVLALAVAARQEGFERLVEGLDRRPLGLRGVQYPEAGIDADRDRVGREQPVAEAVDRRHPGAAESPAAARRARSDPASRPALDLGADPLAQLGRGLVGEGEGEDRVRGDALLADQPAVAVDHHPGLAGSGARLDQDLGAPSPRSPPAAPRSARRSLIARRPLRRPAGSTGARSRRQIGAKSQNGGQTPWSRRPGRGPGSRSISPASHPGDDLARPAPSVGEQLFELLLARPCRSWRARIRSSSSAASSSTSPRGRRSEVARSGW